MAENTVEATLVSRYVDRISMGIKQTQETMRRSYAAMVQSGHAMAAGTNAAFARVGTGVDKLGDYLLRLANDTQSKFKQMGFGALAMAVTVGGALFSITSWLAGVMRDASAVTALKIMFEGLSQAAGWQADTFTRLKRATDDMVASRDLLANTNRVLQSGARITSERYVELTANVHRLARAANVDGVQAHKALTDAIIRGNAESLRAIGINVNVTDAVSSLARATGLKTTQLSSAAKMEAFYAQIVSETRAAVAALPPQFVSLDDAMRRAQSTWSGWLEHMAEGINRSGVLQELLGRFLKWLTEVSANKGNLDDIAVSANRFFISFLQGMATALDAASGISIVWDTLLGTAKMVVNAALAILSGLVVVATAAVGGYLKLLALLPGETGRNAKAALDQLMLIHDASVALMIDAGNLPKSFDGWGNTAGTLANLAARTRTLAGEMERYTNTVVRGAVGTRTMSDAAEQAAQAQQKLKQHLQEYARLQNELSRSTLPPEFEVIRQYSGMLRRIEQLDGISEARKNALKIQAAKATAAELLKIEQQKNDRVYDMLKELTDLAASLSIADVSKLPPPPVGQPPSNIADDPAYRASREAEMRRREEWQRIQDMAARSAEKSTPEWLQPYRDIYAEMERLNQLNLNPFQQTMMHFRDNMLHIGTQVTEAWGSFWADMVTGQENAGKKFLASLVNIIAQQLMMLAVEQTAYGIIAASHLNFAAAARHFAAAAAIGALSGVLTGISANLAQTNSAGAGSTFQQSVARPTSTQQVQVIQVGAAGRAQNAGEVSGSKQPLQVELKLSLDKGVAVREVRDELRRNGPLRTIIQGATA